MLAEKSAVSSYANELSENPTVMFDWTSDFSDDDNDDELERSDTPVQQRMVVLLTVYSLSLSWSGTWSRVGPNQGTPAHYFLHSSCIHYFIPGLTLTFSTNFPTTASTHQTVFWTILDQTYSAQRFSFF